MIVEPDIDDEDKRTNELKKAAMHKLGIWLIVLGLLVGLGMILILNHFQIPW